MTPRPLVTVPIRTESDVVAVRQRTWQIAERIGFERIDRTRLATAVSEIARNALVYGGGGKALFLVSGAPPSQAFTIRIEDCGPGIARLDDILEGRYRSSTGMGIGLTGAVRLVEHFKIETAEGAGTQIEIGQGFPAGKACGEQELAELVRELPAVEQPDSHGLIKQQNTELLEALENLRRRGEESERLRQELEDTNRGVVALYAELDARADQLREASELKSRFLSNMSHEFRTPLNSILALCGLLREHVDGDLTAEQERQVSYIRRSAEDLLALVNDLLDIAKVESGRIDVHAERFSIQDLFSTLRGALRPLQQSHEVELVFDACPDIPTLNTDERKLAQIVRNLVANALKFTAVGQVRVEARARGRDRLRITVADTGIGIAPEHLDKIFEEFAQVGHAANKHVRGTGLGLPLSRRLAAVLGGDITVQSEVGQGSIFTLDMPISIGNTTDPAEKSARVLVADDDDTFRYVLGQSIRSMGGFEVLEASGGEEAIRLARDAGPDVVVLDLQMPDRGGLSVIEELCSDERLMRVPVIVTSSLTDKDHPGPELPRDTLFLPKQSLSRELLGKLLKEALNRSSSDV